MGKRYHKHKGVESNGILKGHPITRIHRSRFVQKFHIMSLKKEACDNKYGKPPKKKTKQPNILEQRIVTDRDGYLAIDMKSLEAKGIRILGVAIGKIWFANGNIKGIQFDK